MNGSEKQKKKNQEYKRTGFNAGELGEKDMGRKCGKIEGEGGLKWWLGGGCSSG